MCLNIIDILIKIAPPDLKLYLYPYLCSIKDALVYNITINESYSNHCN
jgi:hypothetical protein